MGKKLILVCSLFTCVQLKGMFLDVPRRSLQTFVAYTKYFGRRPSNQPRKARIEKKVLNDLEGFKALAGKLPSAVYEFMDFLRNSSKYRAIGATIPKGMLLVGPPGVGKTAIARAIAYDSNRTFLVLDTASCNSKYAGVGTKDLSEAFKEARLYATTGGKKSIIFIDEIDSIGAYCSMRDTDVARDSTAMLNELLNQMDGFEVSNDILVIGATNRKEVLDEALLRPGRFGYIVDVPFPDEDDRRDICMHYLKKMKHNLDAEAIEEMVKKTAGYSADYIKNIINLSGIKAVRDNKDTIEFEHVMIALQEVLKQPDYSNYIL